MKVTTKHSVLLLIFALLFMVSHSFGQSDVAAEYPELEKKEVVSGLLKIKSNPLQYPFRRANLSLEFDFNPRTSIELKAESFPGNYELYFSLFYGGGYGGHLMVRRYNAKHHWFVAGGLSLKQWSYDSLRYDPGSFAGSWETECTYQSASALVPGLKALGGIQYNVPKAPITMEAYVGFGVKFRITETDVHSSGLAYSNCQVPASTSPPVGTSSRLDILGALYFGGNLGFDLFRKGK